MHLAYDLLDGYDALVLVDALPGGRAAGDGARCSRSGPDDLGAGEFDAHGMDPVAVLGGLGALGGTLPPTYVVGCRPRTSAEGIGLVRAGRGRRSRRRRGDPGGARPDRSPTVRSPAGGS